MLDSYSFCYSSSQVGAILCFKEKFISSSTNVERHRKYFMKAEKMANPSVKPGLSLRNSRNTNVVDHIRILCLFFAAQLLLVHSSIIPTSNSEKPTDISTDTFSQIEDYAAITKDAINLRHPRAALPTANECITDIQAQRFKDAQDKLALIPAGEISHIVNRVYNSKEPNFDIVLQFANNVTLTPKNFLIYSALIFEMENNKHEDPLRMIQLVESLKTYIFDPQQESQLQQILVKNLINKIKIASKESLKNAILNKRLPSTDQLIGKLILFDYELFKEIIADIVNESIPNISANSFVSFINESRYLEEYYAGLTAIYNKISADDPALLSLVEVVQKIHQDEPEEKLYSIINSVGYRGLKAKISKSLWNVVNAYKSATPICIRNAQLKEYLYASQMRFNNGHDEKRRYVFTWAPGTLEYQNEDEKNQYRFYVTKESEGIVRLMNKRFPEYMFASSYTGESDSFQVFTWGPGDEAGNWKGWQFIPTGESVYIKHVERNEYLHTGGVRSSDHKLRNVLSSKSGNKYDHSVWNVEQC